MSESSSPILERTSDGPMSKDQALLTRTHAAPQEVGRGDEDPMLEADRVEPLGTASKNHFGTPEEEVATVSQTVVEQARVTYACVSAVRYISVLRQATRSTREIGGSLVRSRRPKTTVRRRLGMMTEPALVDVLLEVLRPQVLGDIRQRPLGIDADACLLQRLEVDVGGVDLHLAGRLLEPQQLGHVDGNDVRLLPGRAACAPDPDRLRHSSPGDDLGKHLGLEILPRRHVPEEPGQVDQDRVEEIGELVDVRLELVRDSRRSIPS